MSQSKVLNELGFLILQCLDSEKNSISSPVAIIAGLNAVLQANPSKELVDQITRILKLVPTTNEKNIEMFSELIKKVTEGDPKFVKMNVLCGIYPSQSSGRFRDLKIPNVIIGKNTDSIEEINAKIMNESDNKITNLLAEKYRPKEGITIFSAINFEGPFLNLFQVEMTQSKDFYVSPTQSIEIPMMKYGSMIMYNEDENIGIRMMRHYFTGGEFYILIMVPMKKFGLSEMERKLTAEKYDNLINTMRPVLGSISIPKFSFNDNFNLKSAFESLGCKMSNSEDFINHFIHGVSMSINENGCNVSQRKLYEWQNRCQCLGGFTKMPEKQEIIADEPFLMSVNYSKENHIVLLSRIILPNVVPSE